MISTLIFLILVYVHSSSINGFYCTIFMDDECQQTQYDILEHIFIVESQCFYLQSTKSYVKLTYEESEMMTWLHTCGESDENCEGECRETSFNFGECNSNPMNFTIDKYGELAKSQEDDYFAYQFEDLERCKGGEIGDIFSVRLYSSDCMCARLERYDFTCDHTLCLKDGTIKREYWDDTTDPTCNIHSEPPPEIDFLPQNCTKLNPYGSRSGSWSNTKDEAYQKYSCKNLLD